MITVEYIRDRVEEMRAIAHDHYTHPIDPDLFDPNRVWWGGQLAALEAVLELIKE